MTAYTSIDIILADDHEIFRDGFAVLMKKIPDIKLVGEAANGEELIRLTRSLKPEVVVTDIKMPKMDGIEATRQIKKEFPHIGIIAFTMFDEESLIVEMLEAGASGYLLKNAHKDEIIAAVKSVHKDQPYYCRDTTNKLAQMIACSNFNPYKKKEQPEFSEKERAVIKYICEEYSNQEIAEILGLSKRTIEGYRERILLKLDAKNSVGIVMYAVKNKIYEYK